MRAISNTNSPTTALPGLSSIAHIVQVGSAHDDLEIYHPAWRGPVNGSYRARPVVTMAPPTAGLHVVQTLNILEHVLAPKMAYARAVHSTSSSRP